MTGTQRMRASWGASRARVRDMLRKSRELELLACARARSALAVPWGPWLGEHIARLESLERRRGGDYRTRGYR